jgi:hypothetical protein
LTEASNLLGQASGAPKNAVFEGFAEVIPLLGEHHVPSRELAGREHLALFGLTDLGILEVARRERSLVITADSPLAAYLGKAGVDAREYRRVKQQERSW